MKPKDRTETRKIISKTIIIQVEDMKLKHENLVTLEQVYALAVELNEPMNKRIEYGILINNARVDLSLDKLNFKDERKILEKRLKVLQKLDRTGHYLKDK